MLWKRHPSTDSFFFVRRISNYRFIKSYLHTFSIEVSNCASNIAITLHSFPLPPRHNSTKYSSIIDALFVSLDCLPALHSHIVKTETNRKFKIEDSSYIRIKNDRNALFDDFYRNIRTLEWANWKWIKENTTVREEMMEWSRQKKCKNTQYPES